MVTEVNISKQESSYKILLFLFILYLQNIILTKITSLRMLFIIVKIFFKIMQILRVIACTHCIIQ